MSSEAIGDTTILIDSEHNSKIEDIQDNTDFGRPTKKSVVYDAIEQLHEEVIGNGN